MSNPALTTGDLVKCGHHEGVVERVGSEIATVDWGPKEPCLCIDHPGDTIVFNDNHWWAQRCTWKWESKDSAPTVTKLNKGVIVEVV